MDRIERGIVAGFLLAAIVLAPAGFAEAADTRTGQDQAKSSSSAEAPLLGRIVVTPSPEQLANIRLERRMIGLEKRANGAQRAGNGSPGAGGCEMSDVPPYRAVLSTRNAGCRER